MNNRREGGEGGGGGGDGGGCRRIRCDDGVIVIDSEDELEGTAAHASIEPQIEGERESLGSYRAEKRRKCDAPIEGSWECRACTFINCKGDALACEMCAVAKTTSAQWAESAAAQNSHQAKEAQEVNLSGSSKVVSPWTCLKCTLVNQGTLTSSCAVCKAPRTQIARKKKQAESGRKEEDGLKVTTSVHCAVLPSFGRKADATERALIMARFKSDRDALKARNANTTGSASALSAAELHELACDRKKRNAARQAEGAQAEQHAPEPADSTQMRGEAACLASNSVMRWELFWAKQPVPGLEAAGLRHLACIKNALALRQPAVQLVRAQYILNPTLLRAFERLRAKHTDHKTVFLFHGTAEGNIGSIISNGFLLKHAQSGPGMLWFSRQSTYSFAYTANQGKGLQRTEGGGSVGFPGGGGGGYGFGRGAAVSPGDMMKPSGRMFVCALLVGEEASALSNVGDKGQDVITMTSEAACLPLYLIDTSLERGSASGMMMAGMVMGGGVAGGGGGAFAGKGMKLGGK